MAEVSPLYVVTASALRLRQNPSTNAVVLNSVPRGTTVELLSTTDRERWSQVRAGRRIGWMASKYLAPLGHATAPPSDREEFGWMPLALGELGVKELEGMANNPRVLEYLRSTELDHELASEDSTPWCSGLVNWCVEHAGFAGTNSAAAKSWLDWGRPITTPRRGCITVLSRGRAGGHVGFFIESTPSALRLLGGNQSNEVSIAGFDKERLLGYRVLAR
jgi:uncharacterized protein (TIGR02594 family)